MRQSVLAGHPARAAGGAALAGARPAPVDADVTASRIARLAEHAELAGDGPAILEFAVAAGDSAAGLGSHREAAYQYGRAMPYVDLLDVDARIDLLGRRAVECQVSDDHERAIEAWDGRSVLLREQGRDLEVVDALLGLDESLLHHRRRLAAGTTLVDEAFDLLDGTATQPPAGAHALPRRGVHFLRASEEAAAVPWLGAGTAMGRAVGDARRGRPVMRQPGI